MAWFYILHSALLDRYYLGHTEKSVEERLARHLLDTAWTSRAKDWRIVYHEAHPDKATAMRREREVKGWKKNSRIELLIANGSERPAS